MNTHAIRDTPPGGASSHGLRLFLVALCLVLTSACANLPTAGEFEVKDSARHVARYSNLYWLDNERVLFQSPDGIAWTREDGFKEVLYRLYIWNTSTGVLEARGEIGGGLCFLEGHVRYWRWKVRNGERQRDAEWLVGSFGSEVVVDEKVTDPRNFNWQTCRPYSDPPERPAWADGLAVRWLRPEHGLLVLGSAELTEMMKNTPIRFCAQGKQERCIDLPLRQRESRGFDWQPFKSAYFVFAEYFRVSPRHPRGGVNIGPWPEGLPMPVWWLYPDGTVDEITLPAGYWLQSMVVPTAVGYATINTYFTIGQAGVYLIRGEKVQRVLDGLVAQQAISPDGCRLAVHHDPRPFETYALKYQLVTLKVIEFCSKK